MLKNYYKMDNANDKNEIIIDSEITPSKSNNNVDVCCKICKEEENIQDGTILIDICDCRGSLSFIHANCLCKWVFLRPSPRNLFANISTPKISDRLKCEVYL